MTEYLSMSQFITMSNEAYKRKKFKEFTIAYHAKQLETICRILKIYIPINHPLIKKDNFTFIKSQIKIFILGKMIFVNSKKYISLSSYNFKLSSDETLQISYYDIVENNPELSSEFIDKYLPTILANIHFKKEYYNSLPIRFI